MKVRANLLALGAGVILAWLAGLTVLTVWPVIGHAPWEDTTNEDIVQGLGAVVERLERSGGLGEPAFSSDDVLSLATSQVFGLHPFGTNLGRLVTCTDASYLGGNKTWVVTCEYYVEEDDPTPNATRMYLFDDQTGELRTGR